MGMMGEHLDEKAVDQHYGRGDLLAAILAGLQAMGKNVEDLSVQDLALIDQFHTRGKTATLELTQRTGIKAGMHVLDVGGGIGGAARLLASEFGCHVTVLDLTEGFCRTGEALTRRTGLSDHIAFHQGI